MPNLVELIGRFQSAAALFPDLAFSLPRTDCTEDQQDRHDNMVFDAWKN